LANHSNLLTGITFPSSPSLSDPLVKLSTKAAVSIDPAEKKAQPLAQRAADLILPQRAAAPRDQDERKNRSSKPLRSTSFLDVEGGRLGLSGLDRDEGFDALVDALDEFDGLVDGRSRHQNLVNPSGHAVLDGHHPVPGRQQWAAIYHVLLPLVVLQTQNNLMIGSCTL
jgi:hypothetical protein